MPTDESSPVVVAASREDDDACLSEEVEAKIKRRIRLTGGGIIMAVGGVAVAILGMFKEPVDIKVIALGMLSGLVGMGAVDPAMVFNFFKKGD